MGIPRSKRDIEAILRTKLLELHHYAADRYTPTQLTKAVEGLVEEIADFEAFSKQEALEIAWSQVLGTLGLSYDDWLNWTRC